MTESERLCEQLMKYGVRVSGCFKDEKGVVHLVVADEKEINKLMQFASMLPRQHKIEKGEFKFLPERL